MVGRMAVGSVTHSLYVSISAISETLASSGGVHGRAHRVIIRRTGQLNCGHGPITVGLGVKHAGAVNIVIPRVRAPCTSRIVGKVRRILCGGGRGIVVTRDSRGPRQRLRGLGVVRRFVMSKLVIDLYDCHGGVRVCRRLTTSNVTVIFCSHVPCKLGVPRIIISSGMSSCFVIRRLVHLNEGHVICLRKPSSVCGTCRQNLNCHRTVRGFRLFSPSLVIGAKVAFGSKTSTVSHLVCGGIRFSTIFTFASALTVNTRGQLHTLNGQMPRRVFMTNFSNARLSAVISPRVAAVRPPLRRVNEGTTRLIVRGVGGPRVRSERIILGAAVRYERSAKR